MSTKPQTQENLVKQQAARTGGGSGGSGGTATAAALAAMASLHTTAHCTFAQNCGRSRPHVACRAWLRAKRSVVCTVGRAAVTDRQW